MCCPAAAATKVCVAPFASDAHLIPEKPAAWEELPRRNRRWRVLKNWALKPGVLRVGEFVDVGSGTCAWRCRRRRAAPGDRCRADAACEFLARAPIKGAALLWFGDTRVTNTPVHAADERRVECALAHEQSGVGGGAVLELFEGEASRESGNVTWESFVHGIEIDICCMQQQGASEPPKCLENFQAKGASARSARSSADICEK